MAGDTFGKLFQVHNWGESHGKAIGVTVTGCPPNIAIDETIIQKELDRRKPGQSHITTQRKEKDKVEILSGIVDGKTTGTPISLIIFNQDQKTQDYNTLKQIYRPSHADFTYLKKYGIRDVGGGGRSSARVTAGSVAAGVIAKMILKKEFKTDFLAFVKTIKNINADIDFKKITFKKVESNIVRCPDQDAAKKMENLIKLTAKEGDSVGGIIGCLINNVPVGLGEPVYDKLEADLAKAMLSINACKGFEVGSGFSGTSLYGSEHNDSFLTKNKKTITKTNYSGGIQGGISNGMPIFFNVAFKPTATILSKQKTVDVNGKGISYTPQGRHDPCVLPRAVPIVEAMAAIVLCDHFLRHRGQIGI